MRHGTRNRGRDPLHDLLAVVRERHPHINGINCGRGEVGPPVAERSSWLTNLRCMFNIHRKLPNRMRQEEGTPDESADPRRSHKCHSRTRDSSPTRDDLAVRARCRNGPSRPYSHSSSRFATSQRREIVLPLTAAVRLLGESFGFSLPGRCAGLEAVRERPRTGWNPVPDVPEAKRYLGRNQGHSECHLTVLA